MRLLSTLHAGIRRLRTRLKTLGKSRFLEAGSGLHIGTRSRLWAPDRIVIGKHVYIGKDVHIESNIEIGDYVLIANRAAFVGRHDHDFRTRGVPVRFAPWVGSDRFPNPWRKEKIVIGTDVWIGFGAIILTGVTIGRGAIVAAGAVVTRNVEPYTIVSGVPATPKGHRFESADEIEDHERRIEKGKFSLSERGYDYCVIERAPNHDVQRE